MIGADHGEAPATAHCTRGGGEGRCQRGRSCADDPRLLGAARRGQDLLRDQPRTFDGGREGHVDDTTYLGFVRDLAEDDEAELLAIPRKQRAEVRRSFTNDLEIVTGEDATTHYRLYAESVRNLGTPVFPRTLFSEVLNEFGPSADILTVRHQGAGVASVLSLYWKGVVHPYWGGGGDAARALRANDAMYFGLMRHARARGCTRFDFGRSKAGTGAAAFKKNWGFEPEPLTYFSRTAGGAVPRKVNPLDPKYSLQVKAWKRMH